VIALIIVNMIKDFIVEQWRRMWGRA